MGRILIVLGDDGTYSPWPVLAAGIVTSVAVACGRGISYYNVFNGIFTGILSALAAIYIQAILSLKEE